tara:strand:+ start:595 stop:723 length:129 start_codon:yes stop_codon:yes gene_type:complete
MINQQIEDAGLSDVQRGVFWFRHDLDFMTSPLLLNYAQRFLK